MKKKTNLSDLSQTHGKLEENTYKTLDQIWGDDGSSRYRQTSEKDYLNFLHEMNKSDLQSHANRLGLIPIDNRDLLTKRLVAEFKKFMSNYNLPSLKENELKISKDHQ